jgi:predicted transcriptional regulator
MQAVMQDVMDREWRKEKKHLALLKSPSKQPKTTTLQVRLEEEVRHNLDRYAEFIDANPSYVVSEALKLLFRKDEEFKRWSGQQTSNHNQQQIKGEALTKTA